ncbi:hypothetical protein A3842_19775 [Paenibacillus sp. P3E]|uniref:hypothetical protein n=1 Tax=Paenibacillus sp. P3E TaxID=1349435 RepID=UPI00093E6E2B|nr:hypothetical protein [Paenibacillus sp. P3E]OKP75532.1 hypothetical protein A3842_19775 [Paenibacillus sp. P3E]
MNGRLVYPVMLLSLLVPLLAGCGDTRSSAPEESAESPPAAVTMPEKKPGDFAFSVRYGITARNEINTFNGTVTKDLISNGTATINLRLTDAEMDDIYQQLRGMNALGGLELEIKDKTCGREPYTEEHWTIQVNGQQETLNWSEANCEITADAKRLEALRIKIVKLVQSRPEYQALPEAVGGYD